MPMPNTVFMMNAPPPAITTPQLNAAPSKSFGSFSYRSSQFTNIASKNMGTNPKKNEPSSAMDPPTLIRLRVLIENQLCSFDLDAFERDSQFIQHFLRP